MPSYRLGFADYAKAHPEIGKPLSDERYFSEDVSCQMTEAGLLLYAATTNSIRFLPATKTLGPPTLPAPRIVQRWTGNHGGTRGTTKGCVLHATRGGLSSQEAEYSSCVNWFLNPVSQASSTIVIGPTGEITEMVKLEAVCWTTAEHNSEYAAVEMAQGRLGEPITDAARSSLIWYLRERFFKAYPHLTPSAVTLPYHSELPQGKRVGKSDLYANGDPNGIAWRAALIARVKE